MFDVTLSPKTTMRFPIYLTLINALCALFITLRMKEAPREAKAVATMAASFGIIRQVFFWLLKSPLALFLIAAGLLHDSIIRLIMTLSSNYYRLVDIPTAWFGVVGVGLGVFGFVVPTVGRRLVEQRSITFNFSLLVVLTLTGLIGIAFKVPYYGVAFVALLGTVMGLLNFFLSNYLNAMIDSSERATVLSFRGLAFNMGYGFVSVLFAMLMRHLTADASPETTQQTIFAASLFWLPWYFLLSLLPLAAFARISGCLRSKSASSGKVCALDS